MPNTSANTDNRLDLIRLAGAETTSVPGQPAELVSRIDALCAELVSIEYWEWLDRTGASVRVTEDEVRQLRVARRELISSELQVLFAQHVSRLDFD